MNTTKTLPLGQIAMTSRVATIKKRNALFSTFVEKCLHRHNYKDWGDANHHDKECNDLAVTTGSRIISVYKAPFYIAHSDENSIWIITEADRSVTTILFPSDY